jgi:hypothetical protein
MKPTKTIASETRPVEVTIWPRTFLTDLKKQLFGENVWVENLTLYTHCPHDSVFTVRDLTLAEVEVYDALNSLIKGITKLEQEGL